MHDLNQGAKWLPALILLPGVFFALGKPQVGAMCYSAAAETSRENVAMSREALREVLAEGRVTLRPDVTNARFEGSLVLSHEEFSSKSK